MRAGALPSFLTYQHVYKHAGLHGVGRGCWDWYAGIGGQLGRRALPDQDEPLMGIVLIGSAHGKEI